jgi:hypothetical protein
MLLQMLLPDYVEGWLGWTRPRSAGICFFPAPQRMTRSVCWPRAAIAVLFDLVAAPQMAESQRTHSGLPHEVEVILLGWGMSAVDTVILAQASHLHAIFYGAGSVRGFTTDALWQCWAWATRAQAGNAILVAVYPKVTRERVERMAMW